MPNATVTAIAENATRMATAATQQLNATIGVPQSTKTIMPPSVGWGNYFQSIGILLFILATIYAGVWLLKRYGKLPGLNKTKFGRDQLDIEGQFHFAPKKSLVVVRFLNKRLLLGVTDQQINVLTEMDADDEHADFESVMEEAGGKSPSS